MAERGLRERKKDAMRQALSEAAVRLAAEHGMDGVSIEDISTEVGVSARTFHNYFSSKEDAVVETLRQLARERARALRERPAGEPVWDSLLGLTLRAVQVPDARRSHIVEALQLVDTSPALRAQHVSLVDEADRQVVAAIAERTGTDAERDMYPRLLYLAASAGMRAALHLRSPTRDTSELVEEAFAELRAGLPDRGAGGPGADPTADPGRAAHP
ncbi:hypothetical protein N566_19615 [Streptomycetaceae bacterium MP113-05]|nr:hypothetical protein N566_19615 [Streptomycetaceae bacterium MP113-05]